MIDLTSGDDDESESDNELPSVQRILASASASPKQNQILSSPKQAGNLIHDDDNESKEDEGNLTEVSYLKMLERPDIA